MGYKTIGSIEMTLDSASIANAISQIKHIQKQLVEAMNDLIERLAEEGVKIAKAEVVAMDAVETGELERTIDGYFDPISRIGYVYAASPHAFYVEYGTGIIGAENQHPEPGRAAWQYDVNGHGDEGWWYPSENGWYVPKGGNGIKLAWTRGMPSRPFMFNTLNMLELAARQFGKTILS